MFLILIYAMFATTANFILKNFWVCYSIEFKYNSIASCNVGAKNLSYFLLNRTVLSVLGVSFTYHQPPRSTFLSSFIDILFPHFGRSTIVSLSLSFQPSLYPK